MTIRYLALIVLATCFGFLGCSSSDPIRIERGDGLDDNGLIEVDDIVIIDSNDFERNHGTDSLRVPEVQPPEWKTFRADGCRLTIQMPIDVSTYTENIVASNGSEAVLYQYSSIDGSIGASYNVSCMDFPSEILNEAVIQQMYISTIQGLPEEETQIELVEPLADEGGYYFETVSFGGLHKYGIVRFNGTMSMQLIVTIFSPVERLQAADIQRFLTSWTLDQ